ncbi:MAG: hypothetical protein A2Y21_07505 [Clostridiales bacterium GWC2_40_7]|nr:MAG: hypothetical protein A2Y21_07505 [Clostridiales bacterium GWC2_40_7]
MGVLVADTFKVREYFLSREIILILIIFSPYSSFNEFMPVFSPFITTSTEASGSAVSIINPIVIFWGSFAAVSKLVLRHIDNFQVLFYIFGSAFLVKTIIFIFSGKIKELKVLTGKDLFILVLYSLPSFFYYFLYIMSLKLIPAVEASILRLN